MAALLAMLLLGAQPQAAPRLSREAYLDLVEQYRRRELDPAVARVLLARKADVERVVEGLLRAPVSSRDAKAAVLMHTETAFLFVDLGEEPTRDFQMDVAERILLALVEDAEFERRWRLVAGYLYQSLLSPRRARHHLDGLFASAEKYLAIAMVYEAMGAFELAQVPRWDASWFDQSRRDRERTGNHRREGRRQLLEAVEYYTRVVAKEPGSPLAHLRRGRCYHALSERDQAARDLEQALRLSPSPYERGLAHLFLGQLASEQGSFAEASVHYRAALDVLPQWQSVHFGLSYALQESGDVAGSRAALGQALQIHIKPNDPRGGIWEYYLGVDEFLRRLDELRNEVLDR